MTEKITNTNETDRDELSQPPTDIGSVFRISDLGTTDGGIAISVIQRAFGDCFGELTLITENKHGHEQTYSFQGTNPIYCCHVPDEAYDENEHVAQTMGFRYSYQFMRDIGEDNPIRVVAWDDTRFPDVEEVIYP